MLCSFVLFVFIYVFTSLALTIPPAVSQPLLDVVLLLSKVQCSVVRSSDGKSSRCTLYPKVPFLLPSLLNETFLSAQLFYFPWNTLKVLLPFFGASSVAVEKSALSLTVATLYVVFVFFLAAFNIFSLSGIYFAAFVVKLRCIWMQISLKKNVLIVFS